MRGLSLTADLPPYTPLVKTGRPAKRERTPFGQRLHTLREQVGFSQQQLADRLGLTQRAYAHWERNPVALRPNQRVIPPSSVAQSGYVFLRQVSTRTPARSHRQLTAPATAEDLRRRRSNDCPPALSYSPRFMS